MVFCSYLLKITDISAVPTTAANNPFAAFGDDPAQIPNQIGRLGTRVLTKKVGSGFVLGTSMTQLTADFVYEPDANAHNVGDVLFVVQGYQQDAQMSRPMCTYGSTPLLQALARARRPLRHSLPPSRAVPSTGS